MDSTPTPKLGFKNTGIIVAAYICGAVGLIIILGVTFCILRKIRVNRARKYIKQQSNRTIAMGPVLTSAPPRAPWKWKEVKANIKARHRGEDRPYSGYGSKHTVAIISNGNPGANGSANGVSRPQSAHSNGTRRPQSAGVASLGASHNMMHGEQTVQVAHHVKHERLRKRIEAKKGRREMKERQKEIKRDLTLILEDAVNGTFVRSISSNGQRLPGDEFPVTHVGPLRRESLMEIPNLTYLIEQSPRDKPVHRSSGQKQLDIPQNLCTWEEEGKGSGSNLSALGGRSRPAGSPRQVLGEVTVHHVTDSSRQDDINSVSSHEDTTHL